MPNIAAYVDVVMIMGCVPFLVVFRLYPLNSVGTKCSDYAKPIHFVPTLSRILSVCSAFSKAMVRDAPSFRSTTSFGLISSMSQPERVSPSDTTLCSPTSPSDMTAIFAEGVWMMPCRANSVRVEKDGGVKIGMVGAAGS